MRIGAWLATLCACGRLGFEPLPASHGDGGSGDVSEPSGAWSPPQELVTVPGGMPVDDPTLTADLLELYFEMLVGGERDIYVMTRASVTDTWSAPTLVAEVSTPGMHDTNPEVSADGLTLYVSRALESPAIIREASRMSRGAAWSTPIEIGVSGHGLTIDATGTYGVVHRNAGMSGGNELLRVQRSSPTEPWSTAQLLTEVNSLADDSNACLDGSGLELYFETNRDGTDDLYVATRATLDAPFGTPEPVTGLNSPGAEWDPWISPDGRTLVFASDRDGQIRFYITTR